MTLGRANEIERDADGFICTGRNVTTWTFDRDAFPLETNIPGTSVQATSARLHQRGRQQLWRNWCSPNNRGGRVAHP